MATDDRAPPLAPTLESALDATLPPAHAPTLAAPASDGATDATLGAPADPTPAADLRVGGRYTIAGELARGGMGCVWNATDTVLARPVLIKQAFASIHKATRLRFERETLITASLQHPAIVPIYDRGVGPDGAPFYAMKRVEGRPLDAALAACPTLSARLGLLPNLIAVCEAMAFAHERGVIHRDLKPANVLVGAFGETVVIDWGIARRIDTPDDDPVSLKPEPSADGKLTMAGAVVGTPAYMPPEQAFGNDVDARADVYALGAMLYELLSGSPPFTGPTSLAVLAAVLSTSPTLLRVCAPDAPSELVAIVEHAMARERARRYPDARSLANDLRAFQTGKLVGAYRYSARELVTRWVRRNRGVVIASAVGVASLGLVGAFALHSVYAERDHAVRDRGRAESEARRAEAAEGRANAQALAADRAADRAERVSMFAVAQARYGESDDMLAMVRAGARDGMPEDLRAQATAAGLFDLARAPSFTIPLAPFVPTSVTWTADGARLRVDTAEGTVLDVDAVTGARVRSFTAHAPAISSMLRAPDGRAWVSWTTSGDAQLWGPADGIPRAVWTHAASEAGAYQSPFVRFSSDSKRVAVLWLEPPLRLEVWDVARGVRTLEFDPSDVHPDDLAWSRDGTSLVATTSDYGTVSWDPATGAVKSTCPGGPDVARRAWLAGDHAMFLTGDNKLRWRDVSLPAGCASDPVEPMDLGTEAPGVSIKEGERYAVVFGKPAYSPTKRVYVVDTERGVVMGVGGSVDCDRVEVSDDGKFALSTLWSDQRLRVSVWSLPTFDLVTAVTSDNDPGKWQALSPSGDRLAVLTNDRLKIFSTRNSVWAKRSVVREASMELGELLEHGRILATIPMDAGDVVLYSTDTGRPVGRFASPPRVPSGMRGIRVTRSVRGDVVAVAWGHGIFATYDPAGVQLAVIRKADRRENHHATSPDGRFVLISDGHAVAVHDPRTGALLRTLSGHTDDVVTPVISDDGVVAVTLSLHRTVRMWDLRTGASIRTFGPLEAIPRVASFVRGGAELLVGLDGGRVVGWDRVTGARTRGFQLGGKDLEDLTFDPTGRWIAAVGSEAITVYDAAQGTAVMRMSNGVLVAYGMAFSADGGSLLAYGGAGALWEFRMPGPDVGARVRALGALTNLRACRAALRLVPVIPFPAADTVFAPDALCPPP